MDKIARMRELGELLRNASRAYYQQDQEIMSNLEYDKLYDELEALEKETGTVLAGSPTVTVGYEAVDELPKERHESPMLSLDKTKDVNETDGYIPLKEVAQRQDISEKYLETIIRLLVKANILSGLRGKGGGYKLTKSPDQYTVGAILRLTEDSLAPVSCLGPGAAVCARAAECRTLHMWQGLDKVINEYLDNVTIADLMKSGAAGDNYVI